jgi:hypothetical protein
VGKLKLNKKKEKKHVHPDQKKQLVLQWTIADKQGCGYYRCIFPSDALNHFIDTGKHEVNSFWTSRLNFDPNFYNGISYVIMQRPATEAQLHILHWLNRVKKDLGFKVIYEIDDDIFNIPEYNPAHKFYTPLRDNIKKVLSECDCLSTTTPTLADLYAPYIRQTRIVRNSLPKWLWGEVEPRHEDPDFGDTSKRFTIAWMGSALHFGYDKLGGDLSKDLFDFIIKTRKKYRWVFSGALPGALQGYRKDLVAYSWKNMLEYPKHAKEIRKKHGFDVGLAFLQDNHFNRAKSDIKRLEYTGLGIPGVYSKLVPYEDCALKFSSVDELEARIEKLRTNPDYAKKVYMQEYGALKNKLWTEDYIQGYFKFLIQNIQLSTAGELKKKAEAEDRKRKSRGEESIDQAIQAALGEKGPPDPMDPLGLPK